MKIRILDNSIRFRVSIDEMERLAEGQSISSETVFINSTLKVTISSHLLSNQIDFSQNHLHLKLQAEGLRYLNTSQKIGLDFVSNSLKVLFEKDFKCLTERGEDESSLYKNPREKH